MIFGGIPLFILRILFIKLGLSWLAVYIPPLFLVFLFVSISYKHLWSFQTFNSKRGKATFIFLVFAAILVLSYGASIDQRSRNLYNFIISENVRGWKGRAHQTDDTLGFKPIPNARAFHTFPIGENIPMAYNSDGFRIPLSDSTIVEQSNNIDIIYLGCSLTYGDACLAEETFPFLVSKETNFQYINAGCCGYGLSHMLILSEKLIPRYKPKFVVLQYSPWLTTRATSKFTNTYFGSAPIPYFSEKDDSYHLELPVYKSQIFDLDREELRSLYQGRYFKFLFEKGIFFHLYEDWFFLKDKLLSKLGRYASPANNKKMEVEKYAYNRIKKIADKNGTTVIILNLGDLEYSKNSHNFFLDSKVYFAEADSLLNEYLENSFSKDYSKEFNHWRYDGKDSIRVDSHPNPKAHRIIANSIINILNKARNK